MSKVISAKANEWMDKQPAVYNQFKYFANQICEKSTKVGAKMIAERVRWESHINSWASEGDVDVYKVPNSYITYMAIRFVEEHPHHKDKFNFRKSPTGKK